MQKPLGLKLDRLPKIKSLSGKKPNIFLNKSLSTVLLQINELDDSFLKFVCQRFSELEQHHLFTISIHVYHCLSSG